MIRRLLALTGTISVSILLIVILLIVVGPASAVTVWTDWTGASAGAPGSASGSVSGVGVSYSGELDNAVINGSSPIWAPDSSFVGGTVTASPSTVGDDLRLDGSFTGVNTITFDSPVENPLFAIWSLGSPGIAASFTFDATPTLQVGGPNSLFGGSSITVLGNVVSGNEGSGVVQFTGTVTSISWTNTFENFYAFTVGVNGPVGTVAEPMSVTLLGSALAALWFLRKRG